MKRKLHVLVCAIGTLFFTGMKAQEYQQLTFTSGLNADVIANGVGSAMTSTTVGVDNANFAFVSNDFQATSSSVAPSYGLNATGIVNSLVTTGLSYQIASFTGNNVLRLPLQNNSGTLAISNGVSATKLYLLLTSGSGISTMTGTITFTDNTTQLISTSTVPDWYNSTTLPVAASGFGRVNRANNVLENNTGNPRMYQLEVAIQPANQTKVISSIQLTKTSIAEGVINLFAITAQVLPTCPSPSGLSSVTTATSGIITWTPPVVAPGAGYDYDYYYSTSSTAPTASSTPSGTVAAGTNSVTLNNLPTGQQQYFWVRSNCSETDKGAWVATTFTTGQVTAVYTLGNISTQYNTSPTITSANTCPGMLSVTVPEGFMVASVSTSYAMSTASNGWMSEQRSLLVCTTSNTTEAAVSSGVGGSTGTFNYTRTGLTLANGLTGTVQFELRAWRTYGGEGCNTTYNMVNNNSWTITVTYEPIPCVTPNDPTATTQTFCAGTTATALSASGAAGAEFNWYTSATEGDVISDDVILTSGTYYVSQTVGTCESERTEVEVIINTVLIPDVQPSQTVCTGSTLNELTYTTTGEVKWYSSESSAEVLNETDVLSSGTYYISQTIGQCESERAPVTVVVNVTPAPASEPITVCSGTTYEQLISAVNGEIYNWYNNSDAIDNESEVISGTFNLSQVINGCESIFTPVVITVNPTPTAPTGQSEQTFTIGETVAALNVTVANGNTTNWYTMNENNEPVAINNSTLLQNGMTYYVSQTSANCESEMFGITATEVLKSNIFESGSFNVYPNPASAKITVNAVNTISQLEIYNMLGQKIISQNGNGNSVTLDISGLPSGNYILQVTASGKTASQKLIKK